MTQSQPIKIDIVSDVVCPWCIIGYKQLEKALALLGDAVEAEIAWHPFELNPKMGPDGQDVGEHIRQKYGSTPEQSATNRERLKAMGDRIGFPFHYGDDMRIYNSFKAHQLLHWVAERHGADAQTTLKLAFFAAYFQDNQDIGDEEVLIAVVDSLGFDAEDARAALNDPEIAAKVRSHLDFWIEQGVSGVPAVIFDGKYLVPGAQEAETFADVIRKVLEKREAA